MTRLYFLFATTTFLSSFLLFQVQPLISKHILPWFGGGSAVWMAAMFFFMIVLAAGYFYALILSRFERRFQVALHTAMIFLTMVTLWIHGSVWPSPITPSFENISIALGNPMWSAFGVLGISVAAPFLLLASTSSLLQLWYGTLSGREPFSLYAVSNAGSLLGLVSYPFFFEPFLATDTQGRFWSYGLFVYGALLILIMLRYMNFSGQLVAASVTTISDRRAFFRWMMLAAVPVATMLVGTGYLTAHVASIPLLWITPLALYLISFIVSFRNGYRFDSAAVRFIMLGIILVALVSLVASVQTFPTHINIIIVLLAMFSVYHFCHEALYAVRPNTEYLPIFYMALSAGGVAASLIVTVTTLYLFVLPVEFISILGAVAVILSYQFFSRAKLRGRVSFLEGSHFFVSGGAIGVTVLLCGIFVYNGMHNTVFQARNFFGHKAVKEFTQEGVPVRALVHGLTNHGIQVLSGPLRDEPAAYYGPQSGIGKVMKYTHTLRGEGGVRVAFAGLGNGTLATYCRPQDQFHFFEIDPQVEFMAREYFSYLKKCPKNKVTISDARIGIKESGANGTLYDLIVLDVYADDMVPAHILTTEAVRMYAGLLAPDGILAANISSRYLDLLPVVAAYEHSVGLVGRYLVDRQPEFPYFESTWAVFSREKAPFESDVFSGMSPFTDIVPIEWTDTYSSLFPIIKL